MGKKVQEFSERDVTDMNRGLYFLAKSSIIIFFGMFLSKLFTYFYKIIIARNYGPEGYGLFSLTLVVVGLAVSISSLGFNEGLSRFIPIFRARREGSKAAFVFNFSRKIVVFTSVVAAVIVFFSAEFISITIFKDESLAVFLKVFSIVVPLQTLGSIHLSKIRAFEKTEAFSFGFNILPNVIKFLVISLLIFLGFGMLGSSSISYIAGMFIALIFSYSYSQKLGVDGSARKKELSKKENGVIVRSFFSYSWPLVFFGILGILIGWTDTLVIGIFMDSYSVGIYNAIIPLAMLLSLTPEILLQMFFPFITQEISAKRKGLVKEISKQMNKWLFIINLPVLLLMMIFPGVFINLFWGSEFLVGTNALRILAIGFFIFSLASVSGNLISAVGKSKTVLSNLIVISALNVFLNIQFVPVYGITGAAIATTISLTVWSIVLFVQGYSFASIVPLRRKMALVFASAIIPAAIFYILSSYLVINFVGLVICGLLFLIIYVGLIFLTFSLDRNDIATLKKVLSKIKLRKSNHL
jgi:O-antigen/teichoic acid export membrane protein